MELAKPKRVGDYLVFGVDRIPPIKNAMNKRNITKEQYAVAPVDIFKSKMLKKVDKE